MYCDRDRDSYHRKSDSSSSSKRRRHPTYLSDKIRNIPNTTEQFNPLSNIPAFESFDTNLSKRSIEEKWQLDARIGDRVIVKIKKFDAAGAYVKPICYIERIKRDLEWADIQIIIPMSALARRLTIGDYMETIITTVTPIRLEFTEASPLQSSQLPEYFSIGREMRSGTTFSEITRVAPNKRQNPFLERKFGFPSSSLHSFLRLDGLDTDREESAAILRNRQDSSLAMKSVVQGVSDMKGGDRQSAIQHFNYALSIDSQCVDALVARGAAYSTDGQYNAAEEDFDKALNIHPDHDNAKKYLVETLNNYASMLDVQGEYELARKKFEKVLKVKEDRRARQGIAKIESRRRQQQSQIEIVDLEAEADKKSEKQKEEERRKRRRESEEEAQRRKTDKKKLEQMEAFILALKTKK